MTSNVKELTKRRLESAFAAFTPKRARNFTQTSYNSPNSTTEGGELSGSTNKCRPWSREDLLARIATYKIHTWLVQSSELNPVRCACNGWVNVDCNTLKCPMCSALLIAQIPEDLTDDEEDIWIERLGQQLQDSHRAACPWKGHACSESLYCISLVTSNETVDELCNNSAKILVFGHHIPQISHKLTEFQLKLITALIPRVRQIFKGNDNHIIHSVPEDNNDSDSSSSGDIIDNNLIQQCLILGLFGWVADHSKPRPAIKCNMCFRSAGLWMFRNSNSTNSTNTSDTINPQTSTQSPQAIDSDEITNRSDAVVDNGSLLLPFNALEEHRPFCYWACGTNTNHKLHDHNKDTHEAPPLVPHTKTIGSIAGWQKVVASILRAQTVGGNSLFNRNTNSPCGDETLELSVSNKGNINNDKRAEDGGNDGEESNNTHMQHKKNTRPTVLGDLPLNLKPFNISAITSAAEAFGIPFSISLLKDAIKNLPPNAIYEKDSPEIIARASENSDVESYGENEHLVFLGNEDQGNSGSHDNSPQSYPKSLSQNDEVSEDEIPVPIDTSGIASLLGGSSLAAALEDPVKAQAILEYVKGLLKARNSSNTK